MELTIPDSSSSKSLGVRSPGGTRAHTGVAESSQSQWKVTRRRKCQLQETSTPTSPGRKQLAMNIAKETSARCSFEKGMNLLYRAAQWVEYSAEVPQVFVAEINGKNPVIVDFHCSTRIDPTTSTFRFFDHGYGDETVEMELEDGTPIEFVSVTVEQEQEDQSCESDTDTESSYSAATEVITPGNSTTDGQKAVKNRPNSPYPITSRKIKSTSTSGRPSVIQYAPAYRCDYHEQDKDDTGEHL